MVVRCEDGRVVMGSWDCLSRIRKRRSSIPAEKAEPISASSIKIVQGGVERKVRSQPPRVRKEAANEKAVNTPHESLLQAPASGGRPFMDRQFQFTLTTALG
jgi:hypothetical protein